MQTPSTALPWNAGWWRLALFVVYWGLAVNGRAQVPNDDCGTALNITPPDPSTQCQWPIGVPGYSTPIVDSTDLALVDFPYPIGSVLLLGYPGFTVGPANDMWFKAWGRYGYSWQIDSPDTCHISIWAGGGCSNLVNYRNYGIANGSVSGSACGAFQPSDTIYFQFSNRTIGAGRAKFNMCLTSACAPWMGASFTYNDPTLVDCFLDNVVTVPCSDPLSSDGEIHVQVPTGNGPFTILWNDGNQSFDRVALDTGAYVYEVIDVDGCMETDTVHLESQVSTTVGPVPQAHGSPCFWVDRSSGTFVLNVLGTGLLSLIAMNGKEIWNAMVADNNAFIPSQVLSSGAYACMLQTSEGRVLLARLLVR